MATYKYTKHGQPYIESPLNLREVDDSGAAGAFVSLNEIELKYGAGIRLYFVFVQFVFCSNILLSICGLISWSLFLADPNRTATFSVSDFFASSYLQSSYWFWPNVVIFISWWFVGPIYFLWERYSFKRIWAKVKIDDDNDLIQENIGTKSRYIIVGVFATAGALAISSALFYGLVEAQRYVSLSSAGTGVVVFNLTANALMSIPVSLGFVVCNTIWDKVAFYVTERERNATWFRFRLSQALKLVVFKVLSTTVLYALIATLLAPTPGCLMQSSGTNFVVTIFIDILLITVVLQTCIPALWYYCLSRRRQQVQRMEFDLSEQLLLVLYRQFIIYLSVFVMPTSGILGLVALSVQYPLDKLKLTKICAQHVPTRQMQEEPGLWLLFFMFFITVAATLTYPNGALWMLFVQKALPIGFQNCSVI